MAQNKAPDYPILSSYLIPKIMRGEVSRTERWMKVDIFNRDFAIVPIWSDHGYQHWYVAILCYMGSLLKDVEDAPAPRIIILDSLFERRLDGENALREYVKLEAKRWEKTIAMEKMMVTSSEDLKELIPGQKNEYDCGLFLLGYCEKFLQDPPRFVQGLVDKTTSRNEWGNLLRPHRLRQQYITLIERFVQSKRYAGMLLDEKDVPIIDGMLWPDGNGLMHAG